MEIKELCIISDSDIPAGSGGINGEGYTYGQLRHQPIITEILKLITHLLHAKWQRTVTNVTIKMDVQGRW